MDVTWSSSELALMSLFTQVTSVTARDCVVDGKHSRIIVVVDPEDLRIAVQNKGMLERMLRRHVEVIPYHPDPIKMIRSILLEKYLGEVKMIEKMDGAKVINVFLRSPAFLPAVVGKGGSRADVARLIAKRYFGVEEVKIFSVY